MSHWRLCVGQLQPSTLRGQLGVMQMSAVSQLGGVQEVKMKLQQAVEWPLIHSEAFKRMGLPHPKGTLELGQNNDKLTFFGRKHFVRN